LTVAVLTGGDFGATVAGVVGAGVEFCAGVPMAKVITKIAQRWRTEIMAEVYREMAGGRWRC
jgi:hypothetical protein